MNDNDRSIPRGGLLEALCEGIRQLRAENPRWNQIRQLLLEMAPPDAVDYPAFFDEVDFKISSIKDDIYAWKYYPLDAATEDLLRLIPGEKEQNNLRRFLAGCDEEERNDLRRLLAARDEGLK